MKWLILVHVLSSIIGIGPTFTFHLLLHNRQSVQELKHSLKIAKILELFPKILGSIAVLTGLILVSLKDYGSFTQLWIVGSLILYIFIQMIVIGFISPSTKKLWMWVNDSSTPDTQDLPEPQQDLLNRVHYLTFLVSAIGILLFVFMIMKPSIR